MIRLRVEDLRDDFDRGFAEEVATVRAAAVDVLVVELGGALHAIRVSDIAAIAAGVTISYLPSAAPAVLGLAGIRGAVVPVFDLAALIGAGSITPEAARWILQVGGELAFGVARVHRHARLDAAAVVDDLVRYEGRLLPLIALPPVVAQLHARVRLG